MNRIIGVVLSYVAMAAEVLSTLLLTPLIISSLGQAEYGVYKLISAVTAYLLLLDLGVGNAVTRYVAKYRALKDRESESCFFGVAIVYYVLVAGLSLVLGWVLIEVFPIFFRKGLSESEILLAQKLLGITMLNAAVTLGTTVFGNVIVAYEKFAVAKGISIVQITLRIVLTALVVTAGFGSYGIVLINFILTLCGRSAYVLYVFLKLKLWPCMRGLRIGFIREIVSYTSLILLQMVATQINASLDQVLLGTLVASSSGIIAVYGVGAQIVQYFQSIGGAFNGVLMPGIVAMVEGGADQRQIHDEMIRIGRIIFMVIGVIFAGFLVFGKEFVILWAGEVNKDGYMVAFLLMLAYLFILTQAVGTQILWAKNMHREQAILKLVIVLVNVFLTVLLIKWRPLIGATIGTLISLLLGDVLVMDYVFVKKLGINLRKYYAGIWKGIAGSLVIAGIAGLIFKRVVGIHSWFTLLLGIICLSIVYLILLLVYGMNPYEKQMVSRIFALVIKRGTDH